MHRDALTRLLINGGDPMSRVLFQLLQITD